MYCKENVNMLVNNEESDRGGDVNIVNINNVTGPGNASMNSNDALYPNTSHTSVSSITLHLATIASVNGYRFINIQILIDV